MISISLILIAWFVEMPLWLSILITVLVGIHVVYRFIDAAIKSWTRIQLKKQKKSLSKMGWLDE